MRTILQKNVDIYSSERRAMNLQKKMESMELHIHTLIILISFPHSYIQILCVYNVREEKHHLSPKIAQLKEIRIAFLLQMIDSYVKSQGH